MCSYGNREAIEAVTDKIVMEPTELKTSHYVATFFIDYDKLNWLVKFIIKRSLCHRRFAYKPERFYFSDKTNRLIVSYKLDQIVDEQALKEMRHIRDKILMPDIRKHIYWRYVKKRYGFREQGFEDHESSDQDSGKFWLKFFQSYAFSCQLEKVSIVKK